MRARLRSADHRLSASTIRRFPKRSLEETIAFLQWLEEGNFVFLGMREYSYAGTLDEPVEEPSEASGLGLLRDPTVTVLRRGAEAGDADAGDPRLPHGARSAHRDQGERRRRASTGATTWTMSASRSSSDGKVEGELRIVGLFTSTRLHAIGRAHSAHPREGRRHPEARRLRSGEPFRQGAAQHPGELSAHRAFPGRDGRPLRIRRWRSCSWRSGRACARLPAATASTASSRCSSSCRATATPPTCASGSALALAKLYDGRVSAFFPDFSHDAPDARAVHHRPQSGRGAGSRRRTRSKRRSATSSAPSRTISRRR